MGRGWNKNVFPPTELRRSQEKGLGLGTRKWFPKSLHLTNTVVHNSAKERFMFQLSRLKVGSVNDDIGVSSLL